MSAALKLDATLHALADPTRRRVIELLRSKPRRAGDLAAAFDMVPPAMSRHLRILRTSGLVEEGASAEDARVRIYRLRAEPFGELREWLEEMEAHWTEQLTAFKAYAEQQPATPRPERSGSRKAGPARSRRQSATTRAKRSIRGGRR